MSNSLSRRSYLWPQHYPEARAQSGTSLARVHPLCQLAKTPCFNQFTHMSVHGIAHLSQVLSSVHCPGHSEFASRFAELLTEVMNDFSLKFHATLLATIDPCKT
jgi:hypothetical protein